MFSCFYKITRSYFIERDSGLSHWIRSSTYLITAFAMMFILARVNIHRQSEMFS